MKRVLLDDYNQSIPKDQEIIGSVTTTWGHLALRNGWKIIEIYETEDAQLDGRGVQNNTCHLSQDRDIQCL